MYTQDEASIQYQTCHVIDLSVRRKPEGSEFFRTDYVNYVCVSFPSLPNVCELDARKLLLDYVGKNFSL